MARPYSSLVEPILDAAQARAPAPMTWRDLVGDLAQAGEINADAPAEQRLVLMTIENMARRGIFARSGMYVRGPAGGRPMTAWLYQGLNPTPATAADGQPPSLGHEQLQIALRGWMQAGV